jgi:hypothetical protein
VAVAVVLAGAAAGHPSGPLAETTTKKASCSVDRAIFDVMFMQLSMASWGGFVCSDGTFEVSAYDLRKTGRLAADRLAELRRLVATLPVEKAEYNFGDYSPDLFELFVRTNVGGRRSYNVFLRAERNPTVSAVFAATQILRGTFESKWAQQFALPQQSPTPSPSPTPP